MIHSRESNPVLVSIKVSPAPKASVMVVVSKKVAKTAATRNRIRRRIKEIIAAYAREHDVSSRVIKVYALAPITVASFKAIQDQLVAALQRTL